MKPMKIVLLTVAAVLAGACSLQESPEFFVNRSNFYRNKSECIAGLNSCYIPLKTIYNFNFGVMTEGVTDLLYHNSPTVYDSRLEISPALPGYGATVWTQCYKAVMYCNAAIEGIRHATVSEDDRSKLLAEGVILRAMYYYLLTSVFGDVPFYTIDVNTEELLNQTARLPRMSAVETRNYLIEELMEVVPDLDQVRSSEIADNRMGAAVGWMLAAKMAMWNKQWDTALEALGELEKIYGTLDQYPLSDIPFRMKNTPESILEIQHSYTSGGLIYTSNYACICMPNQTTAAQPDHRRVGVGHFRRREDRGAGRRCQRMARHAAQSGVQRRLADPHGRRPPRGDEPRVGVRRAGVQERRHTSLAGSEVLVPGHARQLRLEQLQGVPLRRRRADDGRVHPIPDTQVVYSGYALDNKEYEKYGL